ncbi:MAG: nitroreductase family protein [Nitrospirae bacterium]|uniref:nitroreductase family protein n=1 Tax=Candidatus Magnetobacterium casense TaxID=1455061 RepID=UPI0006990B6A|nr:nitroreductase family protein [Candidatus Magnetobacterium casensis]MBF0336858.1 nitroreductase family protein [Nitrospirota bacterium]
MENKALDNILTRCSVRVFRADAVSREDLTKILMAGMAAPSAVNIQPWAFVVVTKRDTLDELCTRLPYAKMLDKATAAIVVCGVPDKDQRYSRDYWVMDCCAATENILLAVHALGLGAVWTAVYPEQDRVESVRAILNIPKNIIPLNVIPIGVPKNKGHVTDKFKQENIHWETW